YWWEQATSYHHERIDDSIWLAEAAYRNNYDLYGFLLNGERDPTNPPNHELRDDYAQNKSIRELLDFSLYYLFPDLTQPAVGDSDKVLFVPGFTYEAAYKRYGDKRYA